MSLGETVTAASVKALNRGGDVLRRIGYDKPSLDKRHLLDAARKRAQLDDFGSWPIDEPLDRLLESYHREAKLTTTGRLSVRELLTGLLENLLLLQRERKSDSTIETQIITRPVFITGLPRTGTTLLHGLLAQDPALRAPATWEIMYPAGFAYTPDAIDLARRRTDSRLAWANRLAPSFKQIHEIAADLPQECIAIMAQGLRSIQFHTTHNVPSYQDWFEAQGQRDAYAFHFRLLQHLQAKMPGDRWVLKAPGHLFGLDALLAQYPDARIVQTHRNPLAVMGSIASLVTVLRRAFSDSIEPVEIAQDWCGRWADALDRSLEVRDARGDDRFFDLAYDDLVADPMAAVHRIYDWLGSGLTTAAEESMRTFLDANPKNKHGAHRYALADFGLDRSQQARRFAAYCARFEISVGN